MREAITKRVARVDKLEELVIKAHGIMFKAYNENCMNHPSGIPLMKVVNIIEFAYRWNDEMKRTPFKDQDFKVIAEYLYTYVMMSGAEDLEEYIEGAKHLLSLRN